MPAAIANLLLPSSAQYRDSQCEQTLPLDDRQRKVAFSIFQGESPNCLDNIASDRSRYRYNWTRLGDGHHLPLHLTSMACSKWKSACRRRERRQLVIWDNEAPLD